MSQPSPSKPTDASEPQAEEADADADADLDVGVDDADAEGTATEDLRALYLDSDDAGELISALSSETARSILVALHDHPATASELADHVGTTVQNVRHHLDSLREADLVRAADTRYSSKGREMDVYAPVDRPLVVVVGNEESGADDTGKREPADPDRDRDTEGFVDSLSRFVGAVAALAATSLFVQWLVVSSAGGDLGGVVRSPDGLGGGVGPVVAPPGLLFFAGGALVLAVASGWRYWRRNHT